MPFLPQPSPFIRAWRPTSKDTEMCLRWLGLVPGRSKRATLCIRGPREGLRQGFAGRAVVLYEKIRNSGKVCTTSTGYV